MESTTWDLSAVATTKRQLDKARGALAQMYNLSNLSGLATTREFLRVYQNSVEGAFNYALKSCFDISPTMEKKLDTFNHHGLRTVFSLRPLPIWSPLYFNTGKVLLSRRRVILAWHHLQYLVRIRQEEPDRNLAHTLTQVHHYAVSKRRC